MADIPGQIEHLVQEDRLTTPVWYEWLLSLRRFVSNAEGAWTVFTPTITSTVAGPPVCASACRFRRIGHTIEVFFDLTVTNMAGAGGYMFATMPVATTKFVQLTGREGATTGKMMSLCGDASPYIFTYYDNSSTLAINVRHIVSGTYEV